MINKQYFINLLKFKTMKKLQIDEENALKLYKTASSEFKTMLEDSFGKAFFNSKIEDRVKTWEDVCNIKDIDPEDCLPYKNPKTKLKKHLNACFKINMISEVLNEGVTFDFNDRSQYKYYPYFEKTSSGWVVCSYLYHIYHSHMGSGFYYTTSEKALYAANQFKDIYLDYLPE